MSEFKKTNKKRKYVIEYLYKNSREITMKVLSLSNCFYYRELDDEVKNIIHHDLVVYNAILYKACKFFYDHVYKGVKLNELLQKMMKTEIGANDYMSLSVTYEPKLF